MKFLILLLIATVLSACNVKLFGTNSGNPNIVNGGTSTILIGSSGAESLVFSVCAELEVCNPQANNSDCTGSIWFYQGYTAPLGAPASTYLTMTDLQSAEQNAVLTPNQDNLNTCLAAIQKLSCASPLITESYSADKPTDYSNTNVLFGADPSCMEIY